MNQLENAGVGLLVHPMNKEQREFRRFETVEIDGVLLQPRSVGKVFEIPQIICQLSLVLLSFFFFPQPFSHPPTSGVTLGHPVVRDLFRKPLLVFPEWLTELPKRQMPLVDECVSLVSVSIVEIRTEILQLECAQRLLYSGTIHDRVLSLRDSGLDRGWLRRDVISASFGGPTAAARSGSASALRTSWPSPEIISRS